MTVLIASDLDRTLIYSKRLFPEASSPRMCVEFLDGEPISFMTLAAAEALRQLAARSHVVPATTRTVDQYRRIDLPGGPFRYAVTSNGGTILVDGEPDRRWRNSVSTRIRDGGAGLDDVMTELRRRIDEQWVQSLRAADDLFCYLVADEAAVPRGFLNEWAEWCERHGWTVSQQGRKIYSVPQSLCKSRAVAEVRRRLVATGDLPDGAPTLAAGDGALDAELLSRADAAIRPAHGELHSHDWRGADVAITATAGPTAAEAIIEWFAEQVFERTGGTVSLPNESRNVSQGRNSEWRIS